MKTTVAGLRKLLSEFDDDEEVRIIDDSGCTQMIDAVFLDEAEQEDYEHRVGGVLIDCSR